MAQMAPNAAWFIDGAYLFKVWQSLKRSDRLDYLKLRNYLETHFGEGIEDAYYFNADADPASARPNPSRIDFFPSSTTSGGMSSYFVLTINSATDLVSPGAFGNSVAGVGETGKASTLRLVSARADAASEVLNKSRRFIFHFLVSFQDSVLRDA